MKVFLLTGASPGEIDGLKIRDTMDMVLYAGSAHATLEGAKAAAQAETDELNEGEEGKSVVRWKEDKEGEVVPTWTGLIEDRADLPDDEMPDDTIYCIRELEVLP